MKLIFCLDDGLGMMFNHRRQSRDRVLISDMVRHVGDRRLYVSPYSAPLFGDGCPCRTVADDPCAAAGAEDYCFVEDMNPVPVWNEVSEVVIYRWNRLYPADVHFKGDMTAFHLIESLEFAGSSHDKITKEVWKR